MQIDNIDLRAFGPEHIEAAVGLSRQARWLTRAEDWQMLLSLSRGVVALEDGERVVGTVLVTPYKDDCATISMVIVDQAMRGRGLGRRLLDAALALAGNMALRLVATADGLPLYKKLGFVEAATVLQHQGTVVAMVASPDVRSAEAADLAAIVALDRAAYGADREALLICLARIGALAVIRRNGLIAGFAALRRFGRGETIGPVVCADLDDARALLSFFMAPRAGAFLRVDTTADTGLDPWLAEQGLAHVGGGVAMRRPDTSKTEHSQIKTFALASQALG